MGIGHRPVRPSLLSLLGECLLSGLPQRRMSWSGRLRKPALLHGAGPRLLAKSKPRGFSLFVRRYGMQALLDRLERNEQAGVVYHRTGVVGDYDGFDSEEALIAFLLAQEREPGCSSP